MQHKKAKAKGKKATIHIKHLPLSLSLLHVLRSSGTGIKKVSTFLGIKKVPTFLRQREVRAGGQNSLRLKVSKFRK
jgi:hypothetical protein